MNPTHTLAIAAVEHSGDEQPRACLSRRHFLLTGGISVSTVLLAGVPGVSLSAPLAALKASYPRQKIGRLSALAVGQPVAFSYPYPNVANILVRLGTAAGGGIGPGSNVVAFNQQCTHMGGPLQGTYKAEHQVLGPCPLHLTTFDLTRHGMVVAGHATESLPQIVLEAAGDDIHAVGVLGLIYGYAHNVTGSRRG
jgi:arsenite oxidase small subunit